MTRMRTAADSTHERRRPKLELLLLPLVICLGVLGFNSSPALAATSATTTAAVPVPSGSSGTTIDPLKAGCGASAPTCGKVGESYGWYDGANVQLLYSDDYYCDSTGKGHPTSGAASGCEAGAPAVNGPPTDTVQSSAPLYIPVPLFASPTENNQCPSTYTCIDHPDTIDLSRLGSAVPSLAGAGNVGLPGHDHLITTRDNGIPEWWNVQVLGVTTPAAYNAIASAKSYDQVKSLQSAGTVTAPIPTNAYLFFQVLPGTVPNSVASNIAGAATAPAGAAPNDNNGADIESGATIDNLKNDCPATTPACENIGLSSDWIKGQDVQALYTEQYFCDTSVSSGASTGCEAGAAYNKLPPGTTSDQIDPLYIPVPLYGNPPYVQCPSSITCIDHPDTIDLSRLGSAVPSLATATNVGLPGHDHILTTRNDNSPEWWPVSVIGVTTPEAMAKIEQAKSYSEVKALQADPNGGVTAAIPTNVFLWFQTLPGVGPATPPAGQGALQGSPTNMVQNVNVDFATSAARFTADFVTATSGVKNDSGYASFSAKSDAIGTTFATTVTKAAATFVTQIKAGQNKFVARDQFINAFDSSKADAFNQLNQAKDAFNDQLNRSGAGRPGVDQFNNYFNTSLNVLGNGLEQVKNTFSNAVNNS